ncbi:MAG: adenylate/guanylate cyclase domain-containing protein, partial [Bythopirellula sp.]
VAWARLVLGITVTLMWPIIHGENLWNLVPRAVATFVLGVLALVWSLVVLYQLRSKTPGLRLVYGSITVDAILINSLLLAYLLAPGASHDSIVEVHSSALVYLAIVMAGIRFSQAAAIFGAVLNSLLFIALVAASTIHVDHFRTIGPAEWLTVGIGLVGATVISITMASRTRQLVEQSAHDTILSEAARARLGAYISPKVADVVLKESELRIGGERQNVAVLFSDLRGFTSYAESLEPEEIVDQLNDYMRMMVDTISQHDGIVDKFMGDGIMAVFGAPIAGEDDADQAIACGKAMIQAIREHNRTRASRGLPPLRHGIGVHYGPVIAGNVGTAERAAYTVIGDTVNLASRLETATKQLPADLVVSEATVRACRNEPGMTRFGEIQVAGREQSVVVYQFQTPSA